MLRTKIVWGAGRLALSFAEGSARVKESWVKKGFTPGLEETGKKRLAPMVPGIA